MDRDKKPRIDWTEVLVQLVTGVVTGIIVLIIDRLW